MPYLQNFGLSRLSPLNMTDPKKEEKNPATEIIEKNNQRTIMEDPVKTKRPDFAVSEEEESRLRNNDYKDFDTNTYDRTEAGVGGAAGKFGVKEMIKHGLKNYVGPAASKIFIIIIS